MRVVSPEKYWKELMDVHNPGVLEVFVGTDQQCYTTRIPIIRSLPFTHSLCLVDNMITSHTFHRDLAHHNTQQLMP